MTLNRTPGGAIGRIMPNFRARYPAGKPVLFHCAGCYFTIRLKVAVCVSAVLPDPAVAVTVTVYVPAGVPGSVGPLAVPLEPPPQPRPMNRTPSTRPIASMRQEWRRGAPMRSIAANGIVRADSNNLLPGSPASAALECGAAVLTERFVHPTPGTIAGLKPQILSLGNPEHEAEENVMLPA